MSIDVNHKRTESRAVGRTVESFALRSLLLFGVWVALAEGEGWFFGLVVSLGTAGLSLRLTPPSKYRIRLRALPRFAVWFLWQSLRAGWDVARRTLHPALPLKPGMLQVRNALPAGAPTWWLMLVLSLLPGTLSVRLVANALELHCLDTTGEVATEVAHAQAQLARLFGLQIAPAPAERRP